MKLIYLEWEDATSQSGWHDKYELENWVKQSTTLIREVGWIYKETKNYIVLVGRTWEDEGELSYGLLQKIPHTWIRKRKTIRL